MISETLEFEYVLLTKKDPLADNLNYLLQDVKVIFFQKDMRFSLMDILSKIDVYTSLLPAPANIYGNFSYD